MIMGFSCIIPRMEVLKKPLILHVFQYFLAAFVVAGTTLLIQVLRTNLSIQVIALLYLLPVVFCTRLWGLGPGILSAMSVFLCLNYYFIPPYYTLLVHQSQDLLALIVFLIIETPPFGLGKTLNEGKPPVIRNLYSFRRRFE